MDRKWIAFLGVLLITVLSAAGMFVGVEVEAQKAAENDAAQVGEGSGSMELDVVIIDNEGYKKDRKGPVEFSHRKHAQDYRVLCWECHHEYKDKENGDTYYGVTPTARRQLLHLSPTYYMRLFHKRDEP